MADDKEKNKGKYEGDNKCLIKPLKLELMRQNVLRW